MLIKTMPQAKDQLAKGESIPKISIQNLNLTTINTQAKSCLCGSPFQRAESFVVLEKPVLTIIGVCGDCSRRLGEGSFKERLDLAARLIRGANAGRESW